MIPEGLIADLCRGQEFDSLAIGLIDFKKNLQTSVQWQKGDIVRDRNIFFDLASLTKPLTLSLVRLENPEIFSPELELLLNHRAGLPAWARLSKENWREYIYQFSIKENETHYSDLGALRSMLEIESIKGCSLYSLVEQFWDQELLHWRKVNPLLCAITGMRKGKPIQGIVHDDNAYCLGGELSHAGLFSTINGLLRTLNKIFTKHDYKLIGEQVKNDPERFVLGFDTVLDPRVSLAGTKSDQSCFGHLGFTGTSFWIYPRHHKCIVILSNHTLGKWYHRENLNLLRKEIAEILL